CTANSFNLPRRPCTCASYNPLNSRPNTPSVQSSATLWCRFSNNKCSASLTSYRLTRNSGPVSSSNGRFASAVTAARAATSPVPSHSSTLITSTPTCCTG